jgi:hypothetical protein
MVGARAFAVGVIAAAMVGAGTAGAAAAATRASSPVWHLSESSPPPGAVLANISCPVKEDCFASLPRAE